jgi:hypothetical protein
VEEPLRDLLSFELGPEAVEDLASRLVAWLRLEAPRRERARAALSVLARDRFGWEGVARGVLAAARGELDNLVAPGEPPAAVRPSNE